MARPLEFDKTVALNAATNQFWSEGFEASSIQKLLDTMGINRGSLYASFGDKETLFKKALEHYEAELSEYIDTTLLAESNPVDAIEAFFIGKYAAASKRKLSMGCMLINTVSELNNVNKKLATLASKKQQKIIEKALQSRLIEAKEKGLIDGDVPELTEYLITLYAGLELRGKLHKNKTLLSATVKMALHKL
ncbi:HTH-type transcriptional repressor ComR [Sinobacterium norvegicum]|uniref:HTH-type transcriptional repressor ComR n=1 Tax=Sinobacterium norvegicum TaxID=1641715 RepID=A0ABM9AAL7_9GAMM|nr:TetR/AcrR family transcriptional regulator [Sinobacterium norvegicum]CAH0990261.1 HTH-type transcriptional repressor ComR [Sinobacterium norvegicum]